MLAEQSSLNPLERRTVTRFASMISERLGDDVVAVWLYGSRARGEPPHPESDVDLMVVTRGGDDDAETLDQALDQAAHEEGANPFAFSVQIVTPAWIADRRRISSFFIGEVDRDKIVLHGER